MSVRIALFGQAPLAVECLDRLLADGHELVAVYAPPDRGRPDAFAARAEALELPLFRRRYFQKKTGEPIDLQQFISQHREDGPAQVAKKVRRSILIYLYREEKVVEGPTLRPPHRVLREILDDRGVRREMAVRAEQRNSSPERRHRDLAPSARVEAT